MSELEVLVDSLFPFRGGNTPKYRKGQRENTMEIVRGIRRNRYVAFSGPTGTGKSPIGTTIAKMFTSLYTTPQVPLVKQIKKDKPLGWGSDPGSAVLTGKKNYWCKLDDTVRCDEGECTLLSGKTSKQVAEFYKKHRGICYSAQSAVDGLIPDTGCGYYYDLQQAIHSKRALMTFQFLMVTQFNYLYSNSWVRNLLIVDEAHDIDDAIRNIYTVRLSKPGVKRTPNWWDVFWLELWDEIVQSLPRNRQGKYSEEWADHKEWLLLTFKPLLKEKIRELTDKVEDERQERVLRLTGGQTGESTKAEEEGMKNIKRIGDLVKKINIVSMVETPFVPVLQGKGVKQEPGRLDHRDIISIEYIPLHVREYFRHLVDTFFDKVLLMGATITDFDLWELGIPKSEYLRLDPPHTFSVNRRPIFHIPCGNMAYGKDKGNHRNEVVIPRQAEKIMEIIEIVNGDPPFDWNTPVNSIVHCVSGEIQRRFEKLLPSEMVISTPVGDATAKDESINAFKNDKGKILLSASCTTGYDFKYDQARLNFIAKMPYRDLSNRFTMARMQERDGRRWYDNKAISQLVQAYGRTTRAIDDSSYTFILDNGFLRLYVQRKRYFPRWFIDPYERNKSRSFF